MRRKPITIDGAEFVISPLTFGQHEEYIFAINSPDEIKAVLDKTLEEFGGKRIDHVFQPTIREVVFVVCPGLNNARKGDEPEWTAKRVYDEMDIDLFRQLSDAILAMTIPEWARIQKQQFVNGKDLGETLAASTIQPSVAAS